jgi:predicted GNAT family acetyltransferase
MVKEKPVSWAWSSDTNPKAVELAVKTDEAHRRRGYARQVASAWAYHNMKRGKVAFYSHKADNFASRSLAKNLGVVRYAQATTYAVSQQRTG